MTIGSNQSLPLVIAAGALVFAGLLSAAALVLDEEESLSNLYQNVATASKVIASTLVAHRRKHPRNSFSEGREPRNRRHIH